MLFLVKSTIASLKASYIFSCIYILLIHMQICPEFRKASVAIFGRHLEMSASSQIIAASLPPSSKRQRLRVFAQLAATLFPVGVDPVKAIMSMPGCSDIKGPRLSSPLKTWKTPGGKIDMPISPSLRSQYGVKGEGFIIMVLPVMSAGPTFPRLSRTGQFQGIMAPHTPIGGWVS